MGSIDYFGIFWVIFCAMIWLVIRKKHPEWIGLGSDFNKQKIDGVKYEKCTKCNEGNLEPVFHSFEKRHTITLPPGLIFVVGTPDEYRCTNCAHIEKGDFIQRKFTRISLAYRLPDGVASKILLKFGFLVVLLGTTMFFVSRWIN